MTQTTPTSTSQSTLLQGPINLPREIIDHILSSLIALYNHDPAYQWTHFRSLTRLHRNQIHTDFLHYWLPKLTLTLYAGEPDTYVEYRAWGLRKNTGKIRYKVSRCEGGSASFGEPAPGYMWPCNLELTTYPVGDDRRRRKFLILRMGEGVLNNGYAGCGLLSDMELPGLEMDECAANLWFDWQAAFSRLMGEEMVMRRFKRELLGRFTVSSEKTKHKRMWRMDVHGLLRNTYQRLRRVVLVCYRDHISSFSMGPDSAPPFDVTPFIPSPLRTEQPPQRRDPVCVRGMPTIQQIAFVEESMVFHIPGWETVDVKELARYRSLEKTWKQPPRGHMDDYASERELRVIESISEKIGESLFPYCGGG